MWASFLLSEANAEHDSRAPFKLIIDTLISIFLQLSLGSFMKIKRNTQLQSISEITDTLRCSQVYPSSRYKAPASPQTPHADTGNLSVSL